MASALAGITFHEKLGTQKERVERIAFEHRRRVTPHMQLRRVRAQQGTAR